MTTFTVTNLEDSGTSSLKQAILDANEQEDRDEIQFDFDNDNLGESDGEFIYEVDGETSNIIETVRNTDNNNITIQGDFTLFRR